jgi:WD repeat-containing protein 7
MTIGKQSQVRLLCAGHYEDLVVIDPFTFDVCLTLQSRAQPDWCASFAVVRLLAAHIVDQDLIVLAATRRGMMKMWTVHANILPDNTTQQQHTLSTSHSVYENESKPLNGVDDVRYIASCAHNPRTVLIVTPRRFYVLDASDFAHLCVEDSPGDAVWLGGHFVSIDRAVVWASNGHAVFFQLPAT